jgi:phage gpG-like protein
MSMRLDIRVSNDQLVADALKRMGARAEAPRQALRDIAMMMIRAQRSRVARGAQGGVKRLAQSTLERKRRQGLSSRPLLGRTGRLLASVIVRGAPDQILKIGRDELRFGTRVFYARFHQFGEGGVPRRRVINLTPRDRTPIAQAIERFLTGVMD